MLPQCVCFVYSPKKCLPNRRTQKEIFCGPPDIVAMSAFIEESAKAGTDLTFNLCRHWQICSGQSRSYWVCPSCLPLKVTFTSKFSRKSFWSSLPQSWSALISRTKRNFVIEARFGIKNYEVNHWLASTADTWAGLFSFLPYCLRRLCAHLGAGLMNSKSDEQQKKHRKIVNQKENARTAWTFIFSSCLFWLIALLFFCVW